MVFKVYLPIVSGGTMTSRAHGLDISKYQTTFWPAESPPKPIDFIVQRSSYGLKTDELFDYLLPGVARVKRRGWYHYYSTGISARDQVDYTVNVIKYSGVKFHFFWGDYEEAYNNLNATSAKEIIYMVKEVEQRTGVPAMLYTNPNIWNTYLEPFGTEHRNLKLALAQYYYFPNPFTKSPSLPKNCIGWNMWQYGITGKYFDTENGKDYGSGNSALDKDAYNGTVAELDKLLGLDQPEPPPVDPPTFPDITEQLGDIETDATAIMAASEKTFAAASNVMQQLAEIRGIIQGD